MTDDPIKYDKDGYELITLRRVFYVETGYCDAAGIGRWVEIAESIRCKSQAEAEYIRDRWLAEGKLKKMPWGQLRPNFDYGRFRIREFREAVED